MCPMWAPRTSLAVSFFFFLFGCATLFFQPGDFVVKLQDFRLPHNTEAANAGGKDTNETRRSEIDVYETSSNANFTNGTTSTDMLSMERVEPTSKATTARAELPTIEDICSRSNLVVETVREESMRLEPDLWIQNEPFAALTCEQLERSVPRKILQDHNETSSKDEEDFDLSLQRLAKELQKLETGSGDALKIVVLGGSMTIGHDLPKKQMQKAAWPRKLEQYMRRQWTAGSIQVVNLAHGGANEQVILSKIDSVMMENPNIILVESAVNDQCDYKDQEKKANETDGLSDSLLSILMNFPGEPAVISVELFRLAGNNRHDADRHCGGHVQEVRKSTGRKKCFYCPQWWKPQDWRKKARRKNSVSYISYRDAVWPTLSRPPLNLCYQYWNGLSHPGIMAHALVASTVLFQFMAVMRINEAVLKSAKDQKHAGDHKKEVEQQRLPDYVCLNPISHYRAIEGDSHDQMDLPSMGTDGKPINSCWKFRADSRDKFGWICEQGRDTSNGASARAHNYLRLSQKISIGGEGKVVLTRLVSYDERMAAAEVWFSTSEQRHNVSDHSESEASTNIFVGDPVWNVTSWWEKKESIPVPMPINVGSLELKDASVRGGEGSAGDSAGDDASSSISEVTINIKMLTGSSMSEVDKFKLVAVVTC